MNGPRRKRWRSASGSAPKPAPHPHAASRTRRWSDHVRPLEDLYIERLNRPVLHIQYVPPSYQFRVPALSACVLHFVQFCGLDSFSSCGDFPDSKSSFERLGV